MAEIRRLLGLKQKDLAKLLKISRDRLASYENFHAPLRYELGDKLCAILDLNQRWLATGELPMLQYLEFPDAADLIKRRALFSEGYDSVLKPWIEGSLKDAAALGHHRVEELDLNMVSNNEWKIRRSGVKPSIDPAELLCPLLISNIRTTFTQLKPELRSKFFRHISRSIIEFLPKQFVSVEGVEKGPFSICQLQEFLARGVFPGTAPVRTEGAAGKQPLIKMVGNSNYRLSAD